MIDYNQKYTLGELENLNIIKLGRGNVISKNDIRNNPGKYPIYSSSAINNGKMGEYGGYMFDDERITWSIDGGGKFFYRNNHKYSVTNVSGWLKVINSDILNTKFLYYLLLNEWSFKKYDYTNKAHPSVIRDDYILHIPSIDVQNEIVEVLDKFSALETELEAELEARTKQYEYYKNKLLINDKFRKIKLSDIGPVKMCRRIFKNQTTDKGDIPFYKIGTFGVEADAYISRELFLEYKDKYPFPNKSDVLLSASGTIGRRVIYEGEDAYFQDSNIVWIDNDETIVLNKYLYYLYGIINWKVSSGGTISRLYNKIILNTEVLVPPLDEQERIVSILDKFSSLVNDIKEGLPAEIELRRKQYEYYRNKLLTFE